MRSPTAVVLLLVALASSTVPTRPASAQVLPLSENVLPPAARFEDFKKLTENAKRYEGMLRLHLKDEHLFAEIPMGAMGRNYLAPASVSKGGGQGGMTLNFEEQWVVYFRRVGDRVQLVRRNVRFQANNNLPIARAVDTTYADSILQSMKIRAVNPETNSVVVDLNEVYFRNFAEVPLGGVDAERTAWQKIKVFPRNIELMVNTTFTGFSNDDAIIDGRGVTVVMHYSLAELPDGGFVPRLADDRVGHFLTAVKDFSKDDKDSAWVRYVNRWRLDRVDGSPWKEGAKLVPPKKKIVFWIEKSVPDEYRAAVREGILEWNKAFEKIGFRDAIEVRQQENEDFDAEDITYSTFRWIASDRGFAMGPSRANPFTGELIDADIIFDASMVRAYRTEGAVFRNGQGQIVDPASLIRAYQQGELHPTSGWNSKPLPKDATPEQVEKARLSAMRQGFCSCASQTSTELSIALMSMSIRADLKPGDKIPDEMIQQAVKDVVMHEVGHTLGLRHNFKASTMLKAEELHDTEITRKRGLTASVMDYVPVNLAPKGVKQGDYFTTTLGVYDYWAIEYAYKPLSGGTQGEAAELAKIASRCAEPGLAYGTDEDLMTTADPDINVWDLGSDTLRFGRDRMQLASEMMKVLGDKLIDNGEGYARTRMAFRMLLRQYGDAAYLTTRQIGGETANRDHRGDPNGRDPFVPIPSTRQREALTYLTERLLIDGPFAYPPSLLRKLGSERWSHWGNDDIAGRSTDFPLHEQILNIQRIVLQQLLSGRTMRRLMDNALKVEPADNPLTIAEVMQSISVAVWVGLADGDKGSDVKSSAIRRNLQREHLKTISSLVLSGNGYPADARSIARRQMRLLQTRVTKTLSAPAIKLDEATRAHLEETQETIAKVLASTISGAP